MKKLIGFGIAALAAIAMAGTAEAANPHFLRATAAGPDAQGDLVVAFKIAGLGDTVTTTVTATADASALYACQNRGGNFPSDPKKQVDTGVVSDTGEFTSGRNGQITGTLELNPPTSTLECPGNQRAVLAAVSYSNVTLSSPDAGSVSIDGTFSRVFFNV